MKIPANRMISAVGATAALAALSVVMFRTPSVDGVAAAPVRPTIASAAQPQPARVTAVHRNGQTFVTWTEIGSPPEPGATMSAAQSARRVAEEQKVRYRVYRSPRPVVKLSDATFVGDVGPLSAWDSGFYGREHRSEDRARWYVIEDGGTELAPGTGLFVYHPTSAAEAYYAVTVETNGVENVLVGGNVSAAVAEAPGDAPPVLQRVEKPKSFNFIEGATLQFYVRWERGPNTARPGQPHDYVVAIPNGVKYPAPVGLHLHGWGGSMVNGYGWWFNAEKGAILVASNQEPYDWWTGYHERLYTSTPRQASDWAGGVVRPYTERRLLSFVDWLGTRMKLDPTRMFTAGLSMGGSGSLMLAIRHPDRIAWAMSWVGVHVPRESSFKSSYQLVWGLPEWNLKYEDGTPVWDYYSDPWYLRRHPDRDVPFMTFSNGKNDGGIGWSQAVQFARALQETRQPHLFVWGQGGHGQRAMMPGGGERVMTLDLRADQSLPAFTRSSLDGDLGNGDANSGDPEGQLNSGLIWEPSSIVDEAGVWEITLRVTDGAPADRATADVTPRRRQQFKTRPGDVVSWTTQASGRVIQSGEATADEWGLVTVPQVDIRRSGSRLSIRLENRSR